MYKQINMEAAILRSDPENKVLKKAGDPRDDGIYTTTIMTEIEKKQARDATRDGIPTNGVPNPEPFNGMWGASEFEKRLLPMACMPEVRRLPPPAKM